MQKVQHRLRTYFSCENVPVKGEKHLCHDCHPEDILGKRPVQKAVCEKCKELTWCFVHIRRLDPDRRCLEQKKARGIRTVSVAR